jgi:regulator of replication initiation timing
MATMNHERQELKVAHRQLADPEKELLQLHERNGDLRLEVQSLTEQLATVSGDSEELARLKQELRDKMADVHV